MTSISRIAISHEDLKEMSFSDLNNQKIYTLGRIEESKRIGIEDEIDKINIKNINSEINSRYTKYALIAGVGVIVGMYALRKFKN
jgi:hypothetical protein